MTVKLAVKDLIKRLLDFDMDDEILIRIYGKSKGINYDCAVYDYKIDELDVNNDLGDLNQVFIEVSLDDAKLKQEGKKYD